MEWKSTACRSHKHLESIFTTAGEVQLNHITTILWKREDQTIDSSTSECANHPTKITAMQRFQHKHRVILLVINCEQLKALSALWKLRTEIIQQSRKSFKYVVRYVSIFFSLSRHTERLGICAILCGQNINNATTISVHLSKWYLWDTTDIPKIKYKVWPSIVGNEQPT